MNYGVSTDLKLFMAILDISSLDLADELDVDIKTINRWIDEKCDISESNLEKLYSYAYKKGIKVNLIKEMLNKEENDSLLLFHGSKMNIEGRVDLSHSDLNNDFGKGFYLSEHFDSAATYVSSYSQSSVFQFLFDNKDLKYVKYNVDNEWMLAIAFFRGRLDEYKDNRMVKEIVEKAENVDYVIAPIADNRMYKIINSFINKEITDEQCKHCLSATNLGFQYVIKSEKAIDRLKMIDRNYLCSNEKRDYLKKRSDYVSLGDDKVKAARIKYRGIGKYIDELLK